MTFKTFSEKIAEHFKRNMLGKHLFKSTITGSEVWDMYLENLKEDPVFRDPQSSTHNCNHCHNFIRRFGNIVAIDDDYNVITLFDIEAEGNYEKVAKQISLTLRNAEIGDVFAENSSLIDIEERDICTLGIPKNVKRYTKEEAELYGVIKPNETRTFYHFHIHLPKAHYSYRSDNDKDSFVGEHRTSYEVLHRAVTEISPDTVNLVEDLITSDAVLNTRSKLQDLREFASVQNKYFELYTQDPSKARAMLKVVAFDNYNIARFRNTLLGTLLVELSEGKELNEAVKQYNMRIDPANYMRAKPVITKKQIEEAKRFIEENNYEDSLNRRHANIDDIKTNLILHINDESQDLRRVSLLDTLEPNKATRHKRAKFDEVMEVSIETFMKDILPKTSRLEVYLENKYEKNFVNLIAPIKEDSKPIFKWDNNFSWTYNGNLTGVSKIKEAVKSRGGNVDADVRFSIHWADNVNDNSDLDAHCTTPENVEIYYSNTKDSKTRGFLDIDIINPSDYNHQNIVENIAFPRLQDMIDGTYVFRVHNYTNRGSLGFTAEIEILGDIYKYKYSQPLKQGEYVVVASIQVKNGNVTIQHLLPEFNTSKKIYNLDSGKFHKVNLVCLSPNYWNKEVGIKHYFFFLEGAKTDQKIRGFHNEFLLPELRKHKRVMEVLANTLLVEPTDKQLAGVGFTEGSKETLTVKVKGTHERIIKIKF